jgi:hypothetical protein
MSLVLVHPKALNKFPLLPEGFFWFYADDSAGIDELISASYGEGRRLLSPESFQKKIAFLRREFLLWLDTVLDGLPGERWIPASVFKDVFVTPMFLHAGALVVLNEARQAGCNVLVVTASNALTSQVQVWGRDCAIVDKRHFWLDFLTVWFQALRQCFWRQIRLAGAGLLARWILGKAFWSHLRTMDVLIDTFLLEGDLQADGVYSNRFLPGMFEYYRDSGCVAAALVSTETLKFSRLPTHYRAMRQSDTLVVPPEYLLRWQDLMRGAREVIRALSVASRFRRHPFRGLDIGILAASWWRIASLRSAVPMALLGLPKRLCNAGAKPALVLVWYENQAADKALQLAFARDVGRANVIALHQYFPFANVVNFFSTDGEVRHGVSAKTHWVCGKQMKSLCSAYDGLAEYRVVPALRYDHLHRPQAGVDGEDLAVFLTSNFEESLAILGIALADISATLRRFRSVVVKPHQALNVDFESVARQRWPEIRNRPLIWERGASVDLLGRAALVLTAGSSVALEAIGVGIPVVIAGRRAGLDVNPLDGIAVNFWRTAYSSEKFEQLLTSWFKSLPPKEIRRANGQALLADYFEPVTKAGMRVFLPDNWRVSSAKPGKNGAAI